VVDTQFHNIYSRLPEAWLSRREQTFCNYLGIDHTYLTNCYLLKHEDLPVCTPCNSLLTVEHILIGCVDFDVIHQNFYTSYNLNDHFHNIHPKQITSFTHASGLTNKLYFRYDIDAICVLKML